MLPTVDAILAKHEIIASGADWYHLTAELNIISLSETLTGDQQEELAAELLAFQLTPFKAGAIDFELVDSNNRSAIQATEAVLEKAVEIWSYRSKKTTCAILRARYADLVWTLAHVVAGAARRDPKMGRSAVEAYLEAIDTGTIRHDYLIESLFNRALNISAQLGDRGKINQIADLIIRRGEDAGTTGDSRVWLYPAKTLLRSKYLTSDQRARISIELEKRFAQVLQEGDRFAAEISLPTLLLLYPKRTCMNARQRLLRCYGEMHRKAAEAASALLAVSSLLPIVELYEENLMSDEADEMRLYVEELGPQVEADMSVISVEQKLDIEQINSSLDELLAPEDMYQALYRLSRQIIPKVHEVRARLLKAKADFPLQFLFSRVSFGNSGLPVSATRGGDGAIDAHLSAHYGRELPLSAWFFIQGWTRAKHKFDLQPDSLVAAIEGSPLVGSNRRGFFREGFAAHQAGDYLKSIHVLVPQVENMLRLLLRFLRIPVSKAVRNRPGLTELKNMNDVLRNARVVETLNEDLHFFLVHLYIEKEGYNLRNDLCHGNAAPEVFREPVSGLVLQSIILLSAIRLENLYLSPDAPTTAF